MKQFLGLTWEQALEEAARQGREVQIHEETEFEYAWIEVSTSEGNGAALEFEDGVVSCYEFLMWL